MNVKEMKINEGKKCYFIIIFIFIKLFRFGEFFLFFVSSLFIFDI